MNIVRAKQQATLCVQQATLCVMFVAVVGLLPHAADAQIAQDRTAFEKQYRSQIRPLMKKLCYECHAGDRTEAEVDLSTFVTLADVRKQVKTWQKVRGMLESGQMPPKDATQPSPDELKQLRRWVREHLRYEAQAQAGDPGPVTLRRLSNREYTYSVRDLTGVASLNPARQFPVDGASGEGFTNAGSGLVMSPALLSKFLEAAKEISQHAVLTPRGIRFSAYKTRRDHSDEIMARIQEFYRRYTADVGTSRVNLQGIVFDTNQGGRLPVDKYLTATIIERDALLGGKTDLAAVAQRHQLNPRYLTGLWSVLTQSSSPVASVPLDTLRRKWRKLDAAHAAELSASIQQWQKSLWKFNSIGHIGRVGGPKAWMESVNPVVTRQELKLKLPSAPAGEDIVLYLVVRDAGDGAESDTVVWQNPRLEGAGQPPLPLSKLESLQKHLAETRRLMLGQTERFLTAVGQAGPQPDVKQLADKHGVAASGLRAWMNYLGVADSEPVVVQGHFKQTSRKVANYAFVNGWGTSATPSVVANSSDQQVRIPGISRPHSVVVHPSPTLFSAVGWQSPVTGAVQIESRLSDAHPECGNGVEWFLQHRTTGRTGSVWQGDFGRGGQATMPAKTLTVRKGDLISLLVGPRHGTHACDLTEVNLVIKQVSGEKRVWNLAKDVSGDILSANPHADRFGHAGVWHFYKGPMSEVIQDAPDPVSIPAGSLLAQWQAETDMARRKKLAQAIQKLVTGQRPVPPNSPAALLYQQIHQLVAGMDTKYPTVSELASDRRFGVAPADAAIASSDLLVRAPDVVAFRVSADVAAGRELVASCILHSKLGQTGSAQVQLALKRPDDLELTPSLPILIGEHDAVRRRVEQGFDEFRALFPAALCYARIVPVDEVVTLTLFHREDGQLRRLMLDDAESQTLDRLWDELYFVSQEPLKLVVAFEQISEFATQDRPDLVKAFKPMFKPINDRATAFRKRQISTEAVHLTGLLELAQRAWRRPLSVDEQSGLRGLYRDLRARDIAHEQAIRLTLARVLTSPSFLYRREQRGPGKQSQPVSNAELATRLSYFLWSTLPDDRLRAAVRNGSLAQEAVVLEETRRMLADRRVRRLAIEFACQWLHVRGFDEHDQKNEKLYPQFAGLRESMYEETIRFFEDMFRNNGSILGLINADHTFLNEALAKHYGVTGVKGPGWRRVTGIRALGRGGVLGMSTVLSSQSGASRTSPILRGNWVYETLLGQQLPRPPANVPQLPESVPENLTARQLIERHSSVPGCAKCHSRIDPYGFALERYDTIGQLRSIAVNTKTRLPDGQTIDGMQGLRDYLLEHQRAAIVRQFCRKLLGYALGREIRLSDEPLLDTMQATLRANGYGFHAAVESIVTSRQFRHVRGLGMNEE